MNTIKIIFENINQEKSEIIIALLQNIDAEGFEQMDNGLIADFLDSNYNEKEIKDILSPFGFYFKKEIVEQKNWNEEWEKNFEPIKINDEVGVRAHFHPPFENVKHEIVITPKMSFGTGHHATTQMMLQYMTHINFENKTVFDFGTGTGVLAIYANIKKAKKVIAIDNDEWCIINAKENMVRNGAQNMNVSINDIEDISEKFDVLLANINYNILILYKNKLKSLLLQNGILLLSGLLQTDKENILTEFQQIGFQFVSMKHKGEWIGIEMILTP